MESKERVLKGKIEDAKKTLLQMSEISLWIDTYDDIFSDFDPRPYSERALSDDFLIEAKKAVKDKSTGQIELKFLAPAHIRNPALEVMIKRRLKDHFKRHYMIMIDEAKSLRKRGIMMALAGVVMIMLATYLSSLNSSSLIIEFFMILLEPAGWFTAWVGLEDSFFGSSKELNKELNFYERMSNAEIVFNSY
jgi:hypothetical protein